MARNSRLRSPSRAWAMVRLVSSLAGMGLSFRRVAALLDDLGNKEEIVLMGRRVGDDLLCPVAVGDLVFPLLHGERNDRSHGFDARNIDFAELLDETEDRVQFPDQPRRLLLAHRDAGEVRDTLDGVDIDGHAGTP